MDTYVSSRRIHRECSKVLMNSAYSPRDGKSLVRFLDDRIFIYFNRLVPWSSGPAHNALSKFSIIYIKKFYNKNQVT